MASYGGVQVIMGPKPAGCWSVHIRKDVAYVPSVAETEAGFYIDIDPVRVVDACDRYALSTALHEAMKDGNPIVPTPSRNNYPEWVVLKPAGVKERTFLNDSIAISISRFADHSEVWQTDKGTGWQFKGKVKRLRADVSPREIAELIVAIVENGDEVFAEEMRKDDEEQERKTEERARLKMEMRDEISRKLAQMEEKNWRSGKK